MRPIAAHVARSVVYVNVCVSVSVSETQLGCAKTDGQIVSRFGGHRADFWVQGTIALDWHHLANTIKGSAHGDDVALFFECGGQIRLTS